MYQIRFLGFKKMAEAERYIDYVSQKWYGESEMVWHYDCHSP